MNDMSNERRPAACKVFWNRVQTTVWRWLSPIGAYAMYLFDEYQQLRQRMVGAKHGTGGLAPPPALGLNGAGAATVHIDGGEPNQIQSRRRQKFQETHIHQPAPKNTSEYPISPLERERIQTRPPRQPLPSIHPHSWTRHHHLTPYSPGPLPVSLWHSFLAFPCSLI